MTKDTPKPLVEGPKNPTDWKMVGKKVAVVLGSLTWAAAECTVDFIGKAYGILKGPKEEKVKKVFDDCDLSALNPEHNKKV